MLFKVALSLPDEGQVTLNYFLKDFQSQKWYWLFRAIFAFGLAVSVLVFLYYRRRLKIPPEEPAVEEGQSPPPPEIYLPPERIGLKRPDYVRSQPKEGDGSISTGIEI